MERIPGPKQSSIEGVSERILTSEQVLEALSRFAEGFTLGRELSDEKGVYLREVEVKGEKEGEMTEYQYKRKNDSIRNPAEFTIISAIYYEDGIPLSGNKLAQLDEETGEWKALHTGDLWG